MSSFIAWYLFLAGTGSGAFVLALFMPQPKTSPSPVIDRVQSRFSIGMLLSACCLILASLCLLFDFQEPLGTWRVILTPFVSITSIGAHALVLFTVLTTAVAVFVNIARAVPRWLMWTARTLGLLLALVTMIYSGVLLKGLIAIEVWNTWLLPALFVASSFCCGLAVLLLTESLLPLVDSAKSPQLWKMQMPLGAIEAFVLSVYVSDRFIHSATTRSSIETLLFGDYALVFWIGVVFSGFLVPTLARLLGKRVKREYLTQVSAIGILVAGFFLRLSVVGIAVRVPLFS